MRSFGARLASAERVEYVKPILFSGGVGQIDDVLLRKVEASPGQLVAKLGT